MKNKEITPYQQNQALKKQFAELGLDLEPVMEFTPMDIDLENRRLQSLGWQEDNEAVGMHLRAELQDFVSMNPQPKEVLDAFNEELEEEIRGFRSADPKNN
ncbi:MAG: hypothetical protein RIC19_23165 [Phaeodactylibacter sp.]|uniref:hypothetical protein n=1 Tax=Phaeodactylibacter sp. TaxID=1940289 RepID=UPI0032EBACF0